MIAKLGNVRVFVHVGPCDMRRQMNGLSGMVRTLLKHDPENGDMFVFRNRRRDLIKILFFDHGGYCLLAKRLEQGAFCMEALRSNHSDSIEITQQDLAALLTEAKIEHKAAKAA